MHDPPSAPELLAAARRHLHEQVIPLIDDAAVRFRTLVAANVLAIVERELQAPEERARAEYSRLATLLGDSQMLAPHGPQLEAELRAAAQRIQRRVATGEYDRGEKRKELLHHLKRTAIENLQVNNPRHLDRLLEDDPELYQQE